MFCFCSREGAEHLMTKITPDTIDDVRLLRLLDLEGWVIDVKCPCGRVVVFPYGMFQRRRRLAGTVLVADLQHLLRCSKCGRRDGFRIEIAEERERGRPGERRIVVVEGRPY